MKKVVSLTMATLMLGSMSFGLAGCNKKFADHDNALEIYVCTGGYGNEWLEKALTAFGEKSAIKEKYPKFEYEIVANSEAAFGQNQVLSGGTSCDLMFIGTFSLDTALQEYKKGQGYLENLNSVFESKIPDYVNGGYEKNAEGVEWTYAEKMKAANPSNYYDLALYDDNGDIQHYASAYRESKYGIIYNKTFIDNYGYKDATTDETILPRTTDELLAFSKSLATKKDASGNAVTPFVYSAKTLYWPAVQRTFWGQYEGAEGYDYYFQGLWENENGEYERNVNVVNNVGILKSWQVLEKLIDYRTGLIHNESAALDFTMAQSYLISGKGLMQANGDWVAQEMKGFEGQQGADAEIRMMEDPIISDLAKDKLQSVETDEEFSAVIGAIRAGLTDLSGEYNIPDYSGTTATWKSVAYNVSQEDYDRIVEANNVYYNGPRIAPMVIPSYATAKNLAKDFMLYIASDEFIGQYMKTTGGASSAFYYDLEQKDPITYQNLYPMQKDKLTQIKGKKSLLAFESSRHPLCMKTSWGATTLTNAEIYFAVKNSDSAKTAQQLFDESVRGYTKDNNAAWYALLQMAGLS